MGFEKEEKVPTYAKASHPVVVRACFVFFRTHNEAGVDEWRNGGRGGVTCRGTKIDTGKRYPFVTVTAPGETKHHHFHHRASRALLHTTRDDLIISVPPANRYCRSTKSRRQKKVLDAQVVSTTGATSSAPPQRIRQQRVKDTLLSLAGVSSVGSFP